MNIGCVPIPVEKYLFKIDAFLTILNSIPGTVGDRSHDIFQHVSNIYEQEG